MSAGETPRPGAQGRGRRLVLRVLFVQVITLVALYALQLRFGLGTG